MSKKPAPMTDETLLAMPADDYMNAAQLAYFQQILLAQKQALQNNVSETVAHLQEGEAEPDPNDRASAEEEHAIELRIRDRERKLLSRVNAALKRIEAEEYGYCEESGEPIGLRRLLARPTASLAIEAQERREFRQRMERD